MKDKKFFILIFAFIFIYFLCFFKQEYSVIFDYCSFDSSSLEEKFVYDYNAFIHGENMKAIVNVSFFHSFLFYFDSNVKSIIKTKNDPSHGIHYGFGSQCN